MDDRAKAIYAMRKNIREQFIDIRANSQVTKALWAFISSLGSSGSLPEKYAGSGSESFKKGKRKRRGKDEDDSGDEYRPQPVAALGRKPKTRSKYKD